METMKIIVAGSRTINNYQIIKDNVDLLIAMTGPHGEIEIVSGGAKGVDKLAEEYAEERGYILTLFYPDWDKYGKAAGPIRNKEMAEYADALVVFWDGKSTGTLNMIEQAEKAKLPIMKTIM